MRPRLTDTTLLDEVDAVRILDRRQTVGDGDRRPSTGGLVESFLDDLLRVGVECRGSLVE